MQQHKDGSNIILIISAKLACIALCDLAHGNMEDILSHERTKSDKCQIFEDKSLNIAVSKKISKDSSYTLKLSITYT